MMDCNRFRELLADLDRPGVLSAELRDRAFEHAEACADCGQLLTESELLDAGLRRLAAREGDSQPPPLVEERLLNVFRQRNVRAARETTWRYAAAIGVAAVLLLAFGFWLNQRAGERNARPGSETNHTFAAMSPVTQQEKEKISAAELPAGERMAQSSHSVAESAKRESASADALVSDADSAAEFIPLPDADPGPMDDGAVVRVEMPRAALANFGLPVEAMEGDGTIRADLIVSADGTPQAIHVLSQDDVSTVQR